MDLLLQASLHLLCTDVSAWLPLASGKRVLAVSGVLSTAGGTLPLSESSHTHTLPNRNFGGRPAHLVLLAGLGNPGASALLLLGRECWMNGLSLTQQSNSCTLMFSSFLEV